MDKEQLLAMAKARGMDIAEESLQSLAALAIDVLGAYAKDNKYLAMIFVGLEDEMREGLKKLIDKVDGQEG